MRNEIWKMYSDEYMLYVEDNKIKKRLDFLKDVRLSTQGYNPKTGKRGWGYMFPARLYNKMARLLKLPLKQKSFNRVWAGKNSKVANNEKRYDLTKVKR